jgi:hypothetical protein
MKTHIIIFSIIYFFYVSAVYATSRSSNETMKYQGKAIPLRLHIRVVAVPRVA